ncbi:MAG TPA: hypothetical protein PKE32_04650, partial [Miltoncostaeaceae bacterium]|nr:hypothetical protein [Miltoncostaeaceae bacterium]
IARTAALAGKALGLAVAVAIITLAIFPGLLVGAWIADMGISPGRLLSACIAQVPLVWVYLAVGLLAAAGLATRRAAAVVTSAALVGAYTVQIVAGVVPALAELDRITPLYWANASVELLQGPQPLRWLGLTGAALLLTVGAGLLFERREIGARRTVRPWRGHRAGGPPPA